MTEITTCDEILSHSLDDPWRLGLAQRRLLRRRMQGAQKVWLPRLAALVEPPAPQASFPAFLLETPPFAALERAIGSARHRAELDTGTADELQRFVDLYRSYLFEPARSDPRTRR